MPFKSEAQRRYLYAKHPEVAAEFEAHTPKGKKLPKYAPGAKPTTHAKVGKLLKKAFT